MEEESIGESHQFNTDPDSQKNNNKKHNTEKVANINPIKITNHQEGRS